MSNTCPQIVHGVCHNMISECDVTEKLIDQCLYTHQSPAPELVIRTSGDYRLSNFLMWQVNEHFKNIYLLFYLKFYKSSLLQQSAHTYIHFVKSLWPEFSAWNFMEAIFCYQHFEGGLSKTPLGRDELSNNGLKFVECLHKSRTKTLYEMFCRNGSTIDWNGLNTMSNQDVYAYYKTHFKP